MPNYLNYLFLALIAVFFIRKWLVFRATRTKLPEYLKGGAVIVDVRSPAEYVLGHIDGSINIPVQELASKVHILDKNKTILLCCASGSRSGVAVRILKSKGFNSVVNAGPWRNLS